MFDGRYSRGKKVFTPYASVLHSMNVLLVHCFSKKLWSERVLFCCYWGGVKLPFNNVIVSVNSISSLSVFILSELLVENVDGENMEEPHAGGAEDKVVLSSSFPVRTVDKAALAQDARGRILNCERVSEENQCGLQQNRSSSFG